MLLARDLALMRRSPGIAGSLLAAAAVFVVSLGFRTIDLLVCTQVPIGTHFVWHLLNGVVVGGLIVLFIRARSDG